jgi:hypothetical protein
MEQITKKQERALDKMIKAIMRKFPFITGWKPSNDFLAYDTMLNIDFIIDIDKLGEFFKTEPEPYYRRVIDKDGPYEVYSLGSPFDYDKNPHIKDISYDTSAKIEELLTTMNHDLPEGFSITYPYTNFRGEEVFVPRNIRRDHYLLT